MGALSFQIIAQKYKKKFSIAKGVEAAVTSFMCVGSLEIL